MYRQIYDMGSLVQFDGPIDEIYKLLPGKLVRSERFANELHLTTLDVFRDDGLSGRIGAEHDNALSAGDV